MATLPSAILVIVDIFEFRTSSESRNTLTVTRMATVTPAILVTVDTFESPRRCASPKTSTVTRMATLPSAIPGTVDIFEFRTSSESRNTSTVTRMATVTPAIPVTVFVSKNPKMMTVTRKREGGVEPNLGKKMAEPNLGKKKTHLGYRFVVEGLKGFGGYRLGVKVLELNFGAFP